MPAFKSKTAPPLLDNQSGFVLVLALLIMVILIIIGVSTTKNSQIDLQIVGNDKVGKQTFYRAGSGTELGIRMLEENIACRPTGFGAVGLATLLNTSGITVTTSSFWQNTPSAWLTAPPTATDLSIVDSECSQPKPAGNNSCYAARAFTFANSDGWQSNIAMAGTTKYAAGSAIQMISGYEGKGKGAAAGGATISYSIVSQALGASNSLSEVEILWRHMIGQEGECNY